MTAYADEMHANQACSRRAAFLAETGQLLRDSESRVAAT
jgi:hypothetical protein